MPKLPVLKAREVLKALKRYGFEEFHQVGSHVQLRYKDNGKRCVTVPVHPSKDIGKATLSSILDQAGISCEEFLQLLKKRIPKEE